MLAAALRTVRILTFNKDQLPTAHRLELGGFDGMLIFNDGQQTFDAEHTTWIRVLMTACKYPNVWNCSTRAHSPSVPSWQTGVALPLHGMHRNRRVHHEQDQVRRRRQDCEWSQDGLSGVRDRSER
eukprot:scaffold136846_cov99-Phaeocystis_antarctica.AAC.2